MWRCYGQIVIILITDSFLKCLTYYAASEIHETSLAVMMHHDEVISNNYPGAILKKGKII